MYRAQAGRAGSDRRGTRGHFMALALPGPNGPGGLAQRVSERTRLTRTNAEAYDRIVMSDHALLFLVAVGGFTIQILGLIVLALMLRESQRLTRAVAGLVYQEGERTRAALGRP